MKNMFGSLGTCCICPEKAVTDIGGFPVCALHDALAEQIAANDKDRRATGEKKPTPTGIQFHV